ncbi:MAG: type II secretion system F family protein [Desulforhopalus sp.]|nr:type II secretion system F family protein [Desulforhopalus sp.]
MPIYTYKGTNSYGDKRKGEVETVDLKTAQAIVKRMRVTNAKVKEKPKDLLEGISLLKPKVKTKEIVIFVRQLSTMINAGLPLVQGLEILEKQQDNSTFKKELIEIRQDVEAGSTLADAMRKKKKTFDNLFTNMIEAGETGGILDTILSRLAGFMEKTMALKKKIKGALTYPTVCLIISMLILVVILVFVVPVFRQMFEGFGHALPVPTQIVVSLSDFFKKFWYWIFLAIALVLFLVKKYYATANGEKVLDRALLYMPVFGPLLRKVAVAKFTRTLSTMLAAGVPILDALQVVARTAGNKVIEQAVLRTADAISEGRPIAEPLEETGVFPKMVVQMINVGESVGALDDMLEKIADFYDEEVDQAVENLTSLIEPFMMVFLGGMIGGIVVAMYLPIFKLSSVMM